MQSVIVELTKTDMIYLWLIIFYFFYSMNLAIDLLNPSILLASQYPGAGTFHSFNYVLYGEVLPYACFGSATS